jgi:hypothetical protein
MIATYKLAAKCFKHKTYDFSTVARAEASKPRNQFHYTEVDKPRSQ